MVVGIPFKLWHLNVSTSSAPKVFSKGKLKIWNKEVLQTFSKVATLSKFKFPIFSTKPLRRGIQENHLREEILLYMNLIKASTKRISFQKINHEATSIMREKIIPNSSSPL